MTRPLLEKSHLCYHTPNQRTLRKTWCNPDIKRAFALGYTLLKIYKVWHFPPNQRKKGFFADYVNTWLKIEQESIVFTAWASTPEDKARYRNIYKTSKGIDLDNSLIVKDLRT